ncbi:MAG: peptidylprolyl isomerase [Betaproteobacteria bacterium]|nr:peptidylprolyl isomerase [Betaproteobacteria bacterium]
MNRKILAALAIAAAPALAFAQAAKEGSRSEPIAKVNGVAVPKARMEVLLQQQVRQGAPDNDQVRAQIRDNLINREVVSQEATKMGLGKSPEVQTQLDLVRQQVLIDAYLNDYVKKHPVRDADVEKEYERVKGQQGGTEYKARHILVDSEDQAKDIIAQLKKGAKFEDLAAKYSKDSGTKDKGGDLDWNVPGVFDRQFGEALTKLDKGKFTEAPVQTRFGYHVIQVDDTRANKFPPLADVKPRIQQQLVQQKIEEAVRGLRAKAKVE